MEERELHSKVSILTREVKAETRATEDINQEGELNTMMIGGIDLAGSLKDL